MKLFFDDEAFDGQLQRSVAKTDAGMATVGECLAIAAQITPGDRASWYQAWSAFAARLVEQADQAARAGHRVSARDEYLRASEYFRQAFFFHRDSLDAVELTTGYAASVHAFSSALPLFDHPGEVLTGDTSGYLFTPTTSGPPYPTILHLGGYDGTAEELYASAAPALARGYAFAAVDGPGQGAMLYERRVPMRPDWEHVVRPWSTRSWPDATSTPTASSSSAGRSAVCSPPRRSGRASPGRDDRRPGPVRRGRRRHGQARRSRGPGARPRGGRAVRVAADHPRPAGAVRPRMVTHGVTTVRAYCADLLRYTNADTAAQVACPSFVADNETDQVSTGQGQVLFDHLTCPKAFRLFTRAEGAEGHCEGMAPAVFWAAAFDWLDTTLADVDSAAARSSF